MILTALSLLLLLIPATSVAQSSEAVKHGDRFGFHTDPSFEKAEVRRAASLNSDGHDQVDAISPDGTMLFLSRTPVKGDNSDVYFSSWKNAAWSSPEFLRGEINDSTNNFIGGITTLGDMIAVIRSGEIAFSHKVNGVWQAPITAKIDSFYTDARFLNFAMSPDGKLLAMALERDDSFGETDLYISRALDDGRWSVPRNAGKVVNTRGFESGPIFSPDGSALYFSSTGLSGYGGYDLFSCQVRVIDPQTDRVELSGARNLGNQINSEANEQFFVLHPLAERGYFTSDRAGTAGDDIFEAIFDRRVLDDRSSMDTGLTFIGRVFDKYTGKRLLAHLEFALKPSKIRVATDSTDGTGAFDIHLPYLATYEMRVTAHGYFPHTESVGVSRSSGERMVSREIGLEALQAGRTIDLKGVHFETGSATLMANSTPAIKAVAKLLAEHPLMRVEIRGHTDNIGGREANERLSYDRALSVVKALVAEGIHTSRLIAIGSGEREPVRSNDTEEGMEANRRVEFFIITE